MRADLIDHMGSDLTVVNAARVSFDKESDWDDEYNLKANDEKLIGYLAKHGHWTPFSHAMVTLRETVPIFVARQRFKHMVGFTYNEVSRRYVDDDPEFFYPKEWRGKPTNAKQGSSDKVVDKIIFYGGVEVWEDEVLALYANHMETAKALYYSMVEGGIAPEQARMVLPQSMYTSYYCTGSLAAWARAYKQRIDPHAQKEIQDLAKQWGDMIQSLFPISWKALTE